MSGREHKLIISGTVGAGKSTAVAAISEIPVITTEAYNNDFELCAKLNTTTAMDYGELHMANGDRLRIYGTPGQRRFEFMWRVLMQGSLGLILLIDNSRPDPMADLMEYLSVFKPMLQEHRAVIGIARTENHPFPTVDEYYQHLHELNLQAPVISVDVRRHQDVLLLIEVLLSAIEFDLCKPSYH